MGRARESMPGRTGGDLLVVDILEVRPSGFGYTAQIPGFGFLRDEYPEPFLVRWEIADGWATSLDLEVDEAGVAAIPGAKTKW